MSSSGAKSPLPADGGKRIQVLFHACGPDRVSKLQMAESVADVREYSHSILKLKIIVALLCKSIW